MNINQLLAQEERKLDDAREKETRARHELESIIERGEREGRKSMTADEDARAEILFSVIREAQSERKIAEGRVEEVRKIKAGEDEYDRASHDVRETPAGRMAREGHFGGQTVEYRADGLGANPRRNGVMLYGAGVSRSDSPTWVYRDSGQPAALRPGQSFEDHPVVRQYMSNTYDRDRLVMGQYGDLGMMVHSLSTSGASAMVPQAWANRVINLMRNKSAVLSANPTFVPMDQQVVNVARLTGDAPAAFRGEGATITAGDPSFDSVVLTSRTISALVTGSLEWFQDSINGEQVIIDSLASALSLEMDKNFLFGGLITGANDEGFNLASPPSPKGLIKNLVDNASGQILGYAANGTAITAATPWNEVLDTIYQPRIYNFEPTAIIWNAKMAKKLAKSYDTLGQPLRQPADLANLPQIVSNQIPSYTRGTMANIATDVVVGRFEEMLVGQRMQLEIRVLNERYAEIGSVGIVAVARVDCNLAHPNAFSVYRALGGA